LTTSPIWPCGKPSSPRIRSPLLHGTRTLTGQVFLVAAITHHRAVILGQRQVPDKRGENAVIADLLTPLDVAGMMLTLDALWRVRHNASYSDLSVMPTRGRTVGGAAVAVLGAAA
jgi:hypothetical protein